MYKSVWSVWYRRTGYVIDDWSTGCLREEYTLLQHRFIGFFLWIKYGHEWLYFIQNFVSFQNMPIFWCSDHHRICQDCLIKIWWILLWRTQNSSCNSEAIWGRYGLKCLMFVHFHLNIILKLHFVSWGRLEAVFS